jgi:hypothetical protein
MDTALSRLTPERAAILDSIPNLSLSDAIVPETLSPVGDCNEWGRIEAACIEELIQVKGDEQPLLALDEVGPGLLYALGFKYENSYYFGTMELELDGQVVGTANTTAASSLGEAHWLWSGASGVTSGALLELPPLRFDTSMKVRLSISYTGTSVGNVYLWYRYYLL